MPAFLKLADIKGEVTDKDHIGWIFIDELTAAISRSIPDGAIDHQRTKGDTTLAAIVISRQFDKSSPRLFASIANGCFFKEVEVHFCTTVNKKQEPYMKYKLHNVIGASYSLQLDSSGDPLPKEVISLEYTKVEWTYIVIDPETGDKKGVVPAVYHPAQGRS